MDDAELLSTNELFDGLDEGAMANIAAAATRQRLARNDQIFSEGDPATSLYVVRMGRIAIAKRSPEGRESVVALMEAGDLFGEMSLFDELGRSAGARALEPSEVVNVPFKPIRDSFKAQPDVLWNVVGLLARRLRSTDEALADSMFLDVTGRTAKRLLELAGGADEFALPVTQEELAGMVGASRERVNKALSQFVRLGWISASDRRYRILNRRQLELRSS